MEARSVRERIRHEEQDVRDLINRRVAEEMLERRRGAHQQTVEMSEIRHELAGFHQRPIASSKDRRSFKSSSLVPYFPDSKMGREGREERPRLPPRSLFQNPWLNNFDIEAGDITRELRGVVVENNHRQEVDASARIRARNAMRRG